ARHLTTGRRRDLLADALVRGVAHAGRRRRLLALGGQSRGLLGPLHLAAGAGARQLLLALLAGRQLLAGVDPDLDADAAVGGPGLVEAVVDLGAQRVQRDAALAVPLRAAHLGAAQTARALDADALRSGLHGVLRRT